MSSSVDDSLQVFVFVFLSIKNILHFDRLFIDQVNFIPYDEYWSPAPILQTELLILVVSLNQLSNTLVTPFEPYLQILQASFPPAIEN